MILKWVSDSGVVAGNVHMSDLVPQLRMKYWGDPRRGEEYAPMDVHENPEKYRDESERTQRVDLRYPIIVEENTNFVIDGMHRLLKRYSLKGSDGTIRAYRIPKQVLEEFAVGNSWEDTDSLTRRAIATQYAKAKRRLGY